MGKIKIENCYIEEIKWRNPVECTFLTDDFSVDVWKIEIDSNLHLLDKFTTVVNPGEFAKANKFYQQKDRERAVISRGALRYILSKYLNQPAHDINFSLTKTNKPFVTDQPDLHFNTSHSGNLILIAVAKQALGVDVEFIDSKFSFDDVLQDNFSNDEINHINQENHLERFFKIWTRKEALTKVSGKGLEEDLKLIPGADGIHFAEDKIIATPFDIKITSFKLFDNYMASVACYFGVLKINLFSTIFS